MIPKFRAWSTFKNEWAKHFYITESGLIYNMEQPHRDLIGAVPVEKSGLILMQSTGLFDKNDVEVFDGDIMFYEQDCYQYTLVKYDKDKLAFVLYDGCERLYHELWEPGEVIGNIYENPELLESVD
ncbi:YopX family protein, partial [Streptococcus pyogenes]